MLKNKPNFIDFFMSALPLETLNVRHAMLAVRRRRKKMVEEKEADVTDKRAIISGGRCGVGVSGGLLQFKPYLMRIIGAVYAEINEKIELIMINGNGSNGLMASQFTKNQLIEKKSIPVRKPQDPTVLMLTYTTIIIIII